MNRTCYFITIINCIKITIFMKFYSYQDKIRFRRLKEKRTKKRRKHKKRRISHLLHRRTYLRRRNILRENIKKGAIEHLRAPTIFNLMKNPNEMLLFFYKVKKHLEKLTPIKIVMKDVTELSVNGLLYLIAIMQNEKAKGHAFHVEGDLPENPFCRSTLQASGFLKYVKSTTPFLHVKDNSILRITSSNKHDPSHIKSLCDFIIEKFKLRRTDTRHIYNALTELVQNTIGHAYLQTSSKDNWFFFARYNEKEHFIDIAFLDTGLGIPTTVRKNFLERIKKLVKTTDADLIFSALNGDFRTQTKLRTRGKGLPSIYERYKEKVFFNFFLMSNFGFIYNESKEKLSHKFEGTLFSWRIKNEYS